MALQRSSSSLRGFALIGCHHRQQQLAGRRAIATACLYLWSQLSADVVGVQGKERLPRPDVEDPLVLGQGQHAVVGHALDAEPRHAVQHICRETETRHYGSDVALVAGA